MRARHGIKTTAEMSSLFNSVQNDEAATELHFSRVLCQRWLDCQQNHQRRVGTGRSVPAHGAARD